MVYLLIWKIKCNWLVIRENPQFFPSPNLSHKGRGNSGRIFCPHSLTNYDKIRIFLDKSLTICNYKENPVLKKAVKGI